MDVAVRGRYGATVTVRQSAERDVLLVGESELYGFAPARARELAAALLAAAAEAEQADEP